MLVKYFFSKPHIYYIIFGLNESHSRLHTYPTKLRIGSCCIYTMYTYYYIHIIHTTHHTRIWIYRVFTKHSEKIQMIFLGVTWVTIQLSMAQFIYHRAQIIQRQLSILKESKNVLIRNHTERRVWDGVSGRDWIRGKKPTKDNYNTGLQSPLWLLLLLPRSIETFYFLLLLLYFDQCSVL